MNEVTTIEPREIAAREPAGADSILQVIERAAQNPEVDIDKMERLLEMYERVTAQRAKAAYVEALAVMQPKLPTITERGAILDRSGKVMTTYALWEDINEAIKPVLSEHGFALTFRTGFEGDRITVTGVLSHSKGHSEETTMTLPRDDSGAKNAVQAVGSSTSYGKRYTASALLNLASCEKDDDATAAGAISEEQKTKIIDLIKTTSADTKKFLNYMGVASVDAIPANQFDKAVRALEAKRKAG